MSEHAEQVHFFNLLETFRRAHPCFEYIYAVPNGGKRHIKVAVYMKQEGTKAGVPDITVPYPSREYHGMYVEMKFGRNTPTPEQKNYLSYLESVGYYTVVCYSAEEAFRRLLWYLRIPEEEYQYLF